MADVFQGVKNQLIPKLPSFNLSKVIPNISVYDGCLISLFIIAGLLLFSIFYKLIVYKVKLLVLEDRGKGFVAYILHAKPVIENGLPKYQIWGNKKDGKPLKINATPSDTLIPLKMFKFFYRDIVIMHKDKNGDFRPWKVIIDKSQIDLKEFYKDKEKTIFDMDAFLDALFPVLKIDNLKMRAWYHLGVKETHVMYQEKGEFLKKYGSIMFALFIIFAICMGAYLFLA